MKRVVCLILVLLLTMLSVVPAMAAVSEPSVSPQYTHISKMYAGLAIDETIGLTACQANCYAATGDSVKLTCSLQRYNGSSWATIKSWSTTGEHTASISKNYAVYSGYTYRLKATCSVYSSAGVLLESGIIYSNQVVY